MNSRYFFFIFHIELPILFGLLIYLLSISDIISRQISNYLPDGLWAYAMTASILLIWDFKINYFWMSLIILLFISIEMLQKLHFIKGTGDINDIIVYLLSGLLSLNLNQNTNINKTFINLKKS